MCCKDKDFIADSGCGDFDFDTDGGEDNGIQVVGSGFDRGSDECFDGGFDRGFDNCGSDSRRHHQFPHHNKCRCCRCRCRPICRPRCRRRCCGICDIFRRCRCRRRWNCWW